MPTTARAVRREQESYIARRRDEVKPTTLLALVSLVLNLVGLGLLRDALLGIVFLLWFAWGVALAVLLQRRRIDHEEPTTTRRRSRT